MCCAHTHTHTQEAGGWCRSSCGSSQPTASRARRALPYKSEDAAKHSKIKIRTSAVMSSCRLQYNAHIYVANCTFYVLQLSSVPCTTACICVRSRCPSVCSFTKGSEFNPFQPEVERTPQERSAIFLESAGGPARDILIDHPLQKACRVKYTARHGYNTALLRLLAALW